MLDLGTITRVRWHAMQISDSIIASARASGPDPIAWVTGNAMMPPLRSFTLAEQIWQISAPQMWGMDAWETLYELVEDAVSAASVYLECPEWDNALYAVDLTRFEYTESPDGENLQDDWRPRGSGPRLPGWLPDTARSQAIRQSAGDPSWHGGA